MKPKTTEKTAALRKQVLLQKPCVAPTQGHGEWEKEQDRRGLPGDWFKGEHFVAFPRQKLFLELVHTLWPRVRVCEVSFMAQEALAVGVDVRKSGNWGIMAALKGSHSGSQEMGYLHSPGKSS